MNFDRIVSIVSLLVGCFLAWYFYEIARKDREPTWSIISRILIEGALSKQSGLEILYKGQKVEQLTSSKILFWNKGREAIRSGDIVSSGPIRITAHNNTKILDATITASNELSNKVTLQIQPTEKDVLVDFDYIDQKHGVIIQVVHTGLGSNDIAITGKIIASKPITFRDINFFYLTKQYKEEQQKTQKQLKSVGILFVIELILFVLLIYLPINIVPVANLNSDNILRTVIGTLLLAVVGLLMPSGVYIIALMMRLSYNFMQYNRFGLPTGLESFEEVN